MIAAVTDMPDSICRVVLEHISPTSAKNYLGCSLRFHFEKILCIPRPVPVALHCGKAIHAALQKFHLARWRGEDDSKEVVETEYRKVFEDLERDEGPVEFKDADHRNKSLESGLSVVLAYLDSDEVLAERPLGVEVLLKEDIPGLSVPLTGCMDLVTGSMVPVDFKSAASKPTESIAAFDHELQLVSYQLLLEQGAKVKPPKLELLYLVKTKTPQVIRVSVPPADKRRKERVVRMLETAVEGISEGRFHPQPGMHCSWCQFRNECLQWRGFN